MALIRVTQKQFDRVRFEPQISKDNKEYFLLWYTDISSKTPLLYQIYPVIY